MNVRKSHSHPQCTSQIFCEDRVLFVWVDFSRSFMLAAASEMRATNSSRFFTFLSWTSLVIRLHKQNSNRVRSLYSNSCISVTIHNQTHVYIIIFFTMTENITPQNTDFPSSITLYITTTNFVQRVVTRMEDVLHLDSFQHETFVLETFPAQPYTDSHRAFLPATWGT